MKNKMTDITGSVKVLVGTAIIGLLAAPLQGGYGGCCSDLQSQLCSAPFSASGYNSCGSFTVTYGPGFLQTCVSGSSQGWEGCSAPYAASNACSRSFVFTSDYCGNSAGYQTSPGTISGVTGERCGPC